MTSVDSFNINLQGTQASQLFLEPIFKSDSIATNFMVMGNVTGGSKKIKYHAIVENILKTYSGCGFQANTVTDFTEKEVYLKKLAADMQFCWEDFADILWESAYRQGAADWTDLTGTAMQDIFQTLFVNALVKDINRLAYFGDESSSDPNFSALDGVWSVIYPREVAANRTKKVSLGSSFDTATEFLASSGKGISTLQDVYENQSTALYGVADADKVFNVSRGVYDRLRKDYQSATYNGQDNGTLLRNGLQVLTFNGIEVVCNPTWTQDVVSAGLDGTLGENFVELTTRFNKVLVSNLNGFDFGFRTWFEQKDEKVYIMSRPKVGFDIIHGTLASVAYK
jgi:hypothetical protein